jgi:hypothetical protein
MRKGEELKAPRYASVAALYNNHMTIYNIILDTGSSFFVLRTAINIKNRYYSAAIK